MKMKRLLSGLLVVAMMLSLCVTTVFAAAADYKAGLTVSKADEKKLSVSVDAGPADKTVNIQGAQSFTVAFDLTVLKPLFKDGKTEVPLTTTYTQRAMAYEIWTNSTTFENWDTKIYVRKSDDGKTCYALIQPGNAETATLTEMVSLAKIYLGFQEGKNYGDVTASTIRFATWAETSNQAEKDAIKFNNGDEGSWKWVPDGPAEHNTLKFPTDFPYVKADGFTFAGGEVAKTLESIAITTQPSKTEYVVGDTFDPAGMVVTATYSDDSTKVLDAKDYTYAPNGALAATDTKITVTYTEGGVTKTADVTITVKEKTPEPKALASIAITTQPNKTEYVVGDTFDPAGMVVTATYSDTTTADVTASCTNNAPAQFDTVGSQTITVTYTEGKVTKTADVTVTVKEKTPPVEKVAAPVISPNGTTFIGTQTVTITSATPGAQIYYTTDGSMPSAKSNPYTMPLTIASGCAIKAIAIKAGMEDSAVTTAYFTLYVPPIVVPGTTPSVASYPITVLNAKNGTVAASHKTAPKGATITLTVAPDKGFAMDGLAVVDGAGAAIKLTDMGNGKYTFIMPASKVTVEGSFKAAGAAVNPFVDVLPSDYCYDAVLWAVNQGVTSGVSSTMFAPNQPCTRAQIVTFLWRAAGSPAPKSASNFTDVPADAYYAKAVAWAVENGITGGTGDGKFSPDATCTRAQAVTFLYRASGSPAVSGSAAFTDVAADAYYAAAVAWAEKNGITGGIGGGLFGSGNNCTRSQIVAFLWRDMTE